LDITSAHTTTEGKIDTISEDVKKILEDVGFLKGRANGKG